MSQEDHSQEDSVTLWVQRLQDRDESAAKQLFERYFSRLVTLCRRKLGGRNLAERDEEDLALSALGTFMRRASQGQFPQLADRDDVGKLLTCIAVRKVLAELRRQRSGVRGRIHNHQERPAAGGEAPRPFAELVPDFRQPEDDPEINDVLQEILARLDEPSLREVFLLRLEGRAVKEIADQIGAPTRRVEYKLEIIRRTLAPQLNRWLALAADSI